MRLRWSIAVSCVLGCGSLARPLTPPERGGAAWTELKSNHFIVDTDLDVADAQALTAELEVTFTAIEDIAFTTEREPRVPIRAVAFNRERDFTAFAPKGAGAYFEPALADGTEAIPTIVFTGGLTPANRNVFQHELTHLFVRWSLGPVPTWLNEGMAQYYSTFELDGEKAIIGKALPNEGISGDGNWHSTRYESWNRIVMPAAAIPSVEQLTHETRDDFYAARGEGDTLDVERAQAANYLAAWGLVHLLYSVPEYQRRFNAMINTTAAGGDADDAFATAFADVPPQKLEADYREHLNKVTNVEAIAKATKYTRPPPPKDVSTRAMSPSDVHVLWARMGSWQAGPPREAARSQLGLAQQLDPSSPEVLYWNGVFALHDDHPDEARMYLKNALAQRPMDARYLIAFADAHPPAAELASTMATLAKVAVTAPALERVARHRAAEHQVEDGLRFVGRATKADPTCWRCFVTASHLFAEHDELDKAIAAGEHALRLLPDGAYVPGLASSIQSYRLSKAAKAKAARQDVANRPASGDAFLLDLSFHGPGALTIENPGAQPLSLRTRLRLEKLEGGKWRDTGVTNMLLDEQCRTDAAPECSEIKAGSVLHPRAWTGFIGCTQCQLCDKNVPAGEGRYRLVVVSCDGATEKASGEIEVKPEGKITGPPWAD